MKKLLLSGFALCALWACNRDDMNGPNGPSEQTGEVPHLYGWMTLDNAAPETRGVAVSSKVWSRPIAEGHLTVKFLNGSQTYRKFVEETVGEWEKYANVKFRFVDDDQDALIRIGFDYVRGMRSSWALTGTDHLQKYDLQNEATVHFAEWRRASDASKRSDALRAFGQVLGLELEFRHPNCFPEWITDADGNIDEETIRGYWEYELSDLISWEELKKVVLDPLSVPAFLVEKTDEYDPNSVMTWPFYEQIAQKLPIVEFDKDYKTELSAQDKLFIQKLYGEPAKGPVGYNQLVTFDYAGSNPKIAVTTNEDLVIFWNGVKAEILKNDTTYIKVPENAVLPYKATVQNKYETSGTRKIAVAELVESSEERLAESYTLTEFDLISGVGMENLDLRPNYNKALAIVRVRGGENFKAQQLNFANNNCLKELYLSGIGSSKVTIDNCPNLEVFATTRYIQEMDLVKLGVDVSKVEEQFKTMPLALDEQPVAELILDRPLIEIAPGEMLTDGPWIPEDSLEHRPWHRFIQPWPCDPQQIHSLDNDGGTGLVIANCPKMKKIGLENTRIDAIGFDNMPELEYVYLSSTSEYVVGGGNPEGNYLKTALSTLKSRRNKQTGRIIVRGIEFDTSFANPCYVYSHVGFERGAINIMVTNRNWAIAWDPEFELRVAD